jgi:hypothetical protein
MALTYLWSFALPFLRDHPVLASYNTSALVVAGLTAFVFLGLGTAVWWLIVRVPKAPPTTYWGFPSGGARNVFHICLILACVFQVCSWAGLFWSLSPSVYSLIRAVSLGLATLAVTVMSYRLGMRELTRGDATVFVILFVVFLIVSAAGLMLAPAGAMFLISIGTFTVGRGRFPLTAAACGVVAFAILHAGKAPMREEFWLHKRVLMPGQYPGFYARWISHGIARLSGEPFHARRRRGKPPEEPPSVLDRSSVVHMLLRVQKLSPEEKPFLYGRTYAIIPELMIPRVFYQEKAWSHEGTYILAVHYGLQTRKATRVTTIGFGLLAESYANFGFAGVIALSIVVGAGLGLATRWCMHVPVTSFRGLFAMVLLGLCVRTEHSAGVTMSSLFQGMAVLFALGLCFMRAQTLVAVTPTPRKLVQPVLQCAG